MEALTKKYAHPPIHNRGQSIDYPRAPSEKEENKLDDLIISSELYDYETENTIRLIPTEGRMSPLQKNLYLSMQNERYLHAPSKENEKAILYPDIKHLQGIHLQCCNLIKELLHAQFAIPDFLSGMQAMDVTILALTKPGDLVLTIAPRNGGHESTSEILEIHNRIHKFLPFDITHHTIDCHQLDESLQPTLIYINHSNILYPHNLSALKSTYPRAKIVFDASQVMGLITAGAFPNPLRGGADVIIGSTHKSLNGPQKGIMATNDVFTYKKYKKISKIMISNNHPASIAALVCALIESKIFGNEYALNVVKNANTLGNELKKLGIPIYECKSPTNDNRITHTQHLWIDCNKLDWNAVDAMNALFSSGIVVNTIHLCGAGKMNTGARGLRLGTTEATRLGMKSKEMIELARLISESLLRRQSCDSISKRTKALKKQFNDPKYCFSRNSALVQKISTSSKNTEGTPWKY